MAQQPLFSGLLTGANLGSTNLDSVTQGGDNSMLFALWITVDITAFTGTSIAVQMLAIDPVSTRKIAYGAAFTALTATGTSLYIVGSTGVGAAAGGITATLNYPAAPIWAVRLIPVAVTNITATVTAQSVALIN